MQVLQKELEKEGRERQQLEKDIVKAREIAKLNESKVATFEEKDRERMLGSLQEQMNLKEQQLTLQMKEIELAKNHELQAQDLQKKLQKEKRAKEELERRLKDVEKSKSTLTRDSEMKMQELADAVESARRATNSSQLEASKELEMMRNQFEAERKNHQEQLRETVELELKAVREDTESKVAGCADQARAKESALIKQLEEIRTNSILDKEARVSAEEERNKLHAQLHEQYAVSARQRNEMEQEKERLAKERDEHSQKIQSKMEELEQKAASDVNALEQRTQEVRTLVALFCNVALFLFFCSFLFFFFPLFLFFFFYKLWSLTATADLCFFLFPILSLLTSLHTES